MFATAHYTDSVILWATIQNDLLQLKIEIEKILEELKK
jgi:uncharacterized protein with HEPN domain